jgi:phosphatidate phosphatase APP1
MNIAIAAFVAGIMLVQTGPKDASMTDLKDGYVRVNAATYTIEVPKDWKVSEETQWGQRKMAPSKSDGELGVMTAPPGRQSWDSLYRTSLFFIMRESPNDKASPYKLTKREDGLEAAVFSVTNPEGFAYKRYVLLRHPEKGLLALSVRIPDRKSEAAWQKHFDRLVKTATFKG